MEGKKGMARVCAVLLAVSLFTADAFPAVAATEPGKQTEGQAFAEEGNITDEGTSQEPQSVPEGTSQEPQNGSEETSQGLQNGAEVNLEQTNKEEEEPNQPDTAEETQEPEQPNAAQPGQPDTAGGTSKPEQPNAAQPGQPDTAGETQEPKQPNTAGETQEPEQPNAAGETQEPGLPNQTGREPEIPQAPEGTPEIFDGTDKRPEAFLPSGQKEGQETPSGIQESGGLLCLDGVPYTGYYLDSDGIFCTVTSGAAVPTVGIVAAGTEYYAATSKGKTVLQKQTVFVAGKAYAGYYLDTGGILYLAVNGEAKPETGILSAGTEYYDFRKKSMASFPEQAVFVAGKAYTGYYMDGSGILYTVSGGTPELKTGTVKAGTEYYSCKEAGKTQLQSQALFVEGKTYTGYYMGPKNKMYYAKKGICTLKTGLLKAGAKYYSCNDKKFLQLPKQTLYVEGKVYSGYYMDKSKKMYRVEKGVRSLKTGAVKTGAKYYSYNAKKFLHLQKQTLYVKGKVYSGYYMDKSKKMYRVEKGVRSLKTGAVKAGAKYYSYNAKKFLHLPKQTLYVKGKVYTGFYMDKKEKMHEVKKGTRTLAAGMLEAGTKYYSYNAKKFLHLPKQALYVEGKVYSGYYMDPENKMHSVQDGTCTLANTTLEAGTRYYSYNARKSLTLPAQTVYVNGKAMEGMSPESLATLQRAQAVVAGITNSSMTQEEKLKACFDFVKTYRESRPRMPNYIGMDWPVIYANDMFVNGTGNCCSYAAAFAYMAKAIGYEEVYCCNDSGHGWAEIDGLIYDPEWSKHHQEYSYYALSYDTKTDVNYKGNIAAGHPWMHIKI